MIISPRNVVCKYTFRGLILLKRKYEQIMNRQET